MSNKYYTFEKPVRRPIVGAFNLIGDSLRHIGWKRPLTAEDILRQARHRTKLHDLGDDYFLDALYRLTEAFEHEAELTPFGRLFIHSSLVSITKTRLRLQDYLRRYPEIRDAELLTPLIVVGLPRTGTTLLYNLLCQDPDARPLMCWEGPQPAPVMTRIGKRDSRIRDTRLALAMIQRLAPDLNHIHPVDPVGPEECTWLMANTLVSPIFGLYGRIPSYYNWLWELDEGAWKRVYDDYVTQLMILQHQKGGGHWVLKSPVHMISLAPLLASVPGARVIFTDRDPAEVVPSACSLFAVVRAISSDHIDRTALGAEMLETLSKFQNSAMAAVSAYPDRVLRVNYRDFTRDKIDTVKQIYTHFGLSFNDRFERDLDRWLAESKHVASHSYGLGQFGLTEQQIRECFP